MRYVRTFRRSAAGTRGTQLIVARRPMRHGTMRLFAAVLPPEDVLADAGRRGRRVAGAARGRTGCAGPSAAGLALHPRLLRRGRRRRPCPSCRPAGPGRPARTEPSRCGCAAAASSAGPGAVGGRRRATSPPCGCWPTRAEAAGAQGRASPMDEHRRVPAAPDRGPQPRRRRTYAPYVAALDGFAGRTWTVAELSLVRSHLPRSGRPGRAAAVRGGGGLAAGRLGAARLRSRAWTRRPETGSWPVCSC